MCGQSRPDKYVRTNTADGAFQFIPCMAAMFLLQKIGTSHCGRLVQYWLVLIFIQTSE